jgi:hypothetical protein
MDAAAEPGRRNRPFELAPTRSIANDRQLDFLFVKFIGKNSERFDDKVKPFVISQVSHR